MEIVKSKKIKIIKKIDNTKSQEYQWEIDFSKWLLNNNNTKQHLQLSLTDYNYDKYIKLLCSKNKELFLFYLNLMVQINGVKRSPTNQNLPKNYQCKIAYSSLFKRNLPIEKLNQLAQSKGYQDALDLFNPERDKDGITRNIKISLSRDYVIPYLNELKKLNLIEWEPYIGTNTKPTGLFYVGIVNNEIPVADDFTTHYDFLAIPYRMLFNTTKFTNKHLFAFISMYKAKKTITRCKDGECLIDFSKIIDAYKIDEKIKQCLNLPKDIDIKEYLTRELTQAFIELMESETMKQGDTIINELTTGLDIKDIDKYKKQTLTHFQEVVYDKSMESDKWLYVYDRLFYYTNDFIDTSQIIVNDNLRAIVVKYGGKNIDKIREVFNESGEYLEQVLKKIIETSFNCKYNLSFVV